MEEGCANISILTKDFNIPRITSDDEYFYFPYVTMETSVVEHRTGVNVTTTKIMKMEYSPYKVYIEFRRCFRPGLPINGQFKLVNILQKYENETKTVCYNMVTEQNDGFRELEQCSNLTFDDRNRLHFIIPPLKPKVTNIYLKVSFFICIN